MEKRKKPLKLGKYKLWTKNDDEKLTQVFKSITFKGSHQKNHLLIKEILETKGINRTEKAIARRLYRLGLKFFKVDDKEKITKCEDCGKKFYCSQRYLTRKSKIKYCDDCRPKHKHDWNKKNRDRVLEYHHRYNKKYNSKSK